MRIAFYAPLKPPGHPVPSGDRLMARMLIACLERAGHTVEIASELRAFIGDLQDEAGRDALLRDADTEIVRLTGAWQRQGAPDLWFCYHLYYKAPDLLGPILCNAFGTPYVTVEASYSARRNRGVWTALQARVLAAIEQAAVNICLTARDREGLLEAAPAAHIARLRPFIDTADFVARPLQPQPFRLVTVAMMRAGDKFDSYRGLAAALVLLPDLPWHLSVVGDGPLREEVTALFAALPSDRITWHGEQDRAGIAAIFSHCAVYVWPGCGEAFGLAYLEAQAAGLPVIAYDTAGVPEVVVDGETGILTAPGDPAAYAAAIAGLLADEESRGRMAKHARARVVGTHSLEAAAATLDTILRDFVGIQI